jgi:hypothetical protein
MAMLASRSQARSEDQGLAGLTGYSSNACLARRSKLTLFALPRFRVATR